MEGCRTTEDAIRLLHSYNFVAQIQDHPRGSLADPRGPLGTCTSLCQIHKFESPSLGVGTLRQILDPPLICFLRLLTRLTGEADLGEKEFLFGSEADPSTESMSREVDLFQNFALL